MDRKTKNSPTDGIGRRRVRTGHDDNSRNFSRAHLALFLRNRLWLGAPVAALLAFVATFLLRCLGDGKPVGDTLRVGAIFAAVTAGCWALGVWAATDPSEKEEDAEEDAEPPVPASRWQLVGRRALLVVLLLGVLALINAPQIEALLKGEASLPRFFGGILLKTLAVASILLPALIARNAKS